MAIDKLIYIFVIIFSTLLGGCGDSNSGGTSTGNGLVDVDIANFNPALKPQFQALTVNSLTVCFKRLRFKMAGESTETDPTLDEDNIDLSLGQVTLSSAGTDLNTSVSVPVGIYKRIEFDLEKDCDGVSTLNSVDLDNGTVYSSQEHITIKFDGTFIVTNGSQNLALGIQAIVSALQSVTSNAEIRTQAESASGSF